MAQIRWLASDDAPEDFPDPELALREPDGLLAVGGDLSPRRLLAAYRRGIFPWYNEGQPILWWSPDPRAVLYPRELHVSRSLRRTMRRAGFSVSFDQAFGAVVAECGELRADTGTWITPEMSQAYTALHDRGHAHSVEVWQGHTLAGGLYGVNLGRVFFGESMFSRVTDASKVALTALVAACEQFGIRLLDCQVASPHLARLGARLVPRTRFLTLLDRYCDYPDPGPWAHGPYPARTLA